MKTDQPLPPPKAPEPSIRRGSPGKVPRDVAARIRRMIEADQGKR